MAGRLYPDPAGTRWKDRKMVPAPGVVATLAPCPGPPPGSRPGGCLSPTTPPTHTDSHTHWPAWVAKGLLEPIPGDFRSWLSSWRSRFSSHMSTEEALWEAFWGGPGGTGRPTRGPWSRSVPHPRASKSFPDSAVLVPILQKRKPRLREVGWTPQNHSAMWPASQGLCLTEPPAIAAPAG